MKKILFIFLLFVLASSSFGQTYTNKDYRLDSINMYGLVDTMICYEKSGRKADMNAHMWVDIESLTQVNHTIQMGYQSKKSKVHSPVDLAFYEEFTTDKTTVLQIREGDSAYVKHWVKDVFNGECPCIYIKTGTAESDTAMIYWGFEFFKER